MKLKEQSSVQVMAAESLLNWANGIRFTMAIDPGRALFKEQVQTHGFSFLDDYLNNILLNAKQDALIELVKTPSRKRTLTKRPKVASKLKEGTTLFLEDEESHHNTIQDVTALSHSSLQHRHSAEELSANAKCPPAQVAHYDTAVLEIPSSNPVNLHRSSHSEAKDLSVIAEDDETADRSRASLLLPDATIAVHEQDAEREPLRDPRPVPPSPKANSPLPAPAPLHKSVHSGTENLIGPSVLGAATSGAPVTGKRTSWLQKARQANALEIAGRKTISSFSTASQLQLSSATLLTHNAKRKSTEAFNEPVEDDVERHHKVAKTTAADTAPTNNDVNLATHSGSALAKVTSPLHSEEPHAQTKQLEEEGMLDLLKKTVEGLGARAGKNAGKSLGGPAVTALAEARAAAEARIAERNMKEETMTVVYHPTLEKSNERDGETFKYQPLASELSYNLGNQSIKSGLAEPPALLTAEGSNQILLPNAASDEVSAIDEVRNQGTTTTTPPSTPPLNRDIFIPPPGPVFNKPPPVFVAPSQVKEAALDQIEKLLPENLPSSSKDSLTIKSSALGVVFDKEQSIPVWMLNAQDTVFAHSQNANNCDEDDSWPIDEKLAEGVQWIYEDAKDDNTTWSSLPSQQNTGDLSTNVPKSAMGSSGNQYQAVIKEAGDNDLNTYSTGVDQEVQSVMSDSEPDDEPQNATMSSLLKSQSQTSNSSSLQQSNVGFFGQATKLISNIMGTSKQAKPEVKKVLQKAAVAAKKQQEESDKKAARLKEMENRRQQAIQRKAEEEKARIMEQEKKIKEENERRKREREEHTDKRPLKVTNGRKEDDTSKKRKIEVDKKQDVKNSSINVPKSAVKLTIKQPSALSSSAAYNSSLNTGGSSVWGAKPDVGSMKPGAGSTKSKGKMPAKAPTTDEELPQPSQIVQIQMAARAKAQLRAAKQANEPVPSESIELPDIHSEYSDSEDEDRQRTFDPPDWAQSPELRQALQQQSTINPDDIFGAIRPLRMEEIFKTRKSRFRARTSSANWAGADRLTVEEEKEYARRMGFK
ncbi:hypothetical protein APHAL10511_006387 [Amanita phalloides]|nr:hypothetical protein APHAL10511_006387 [Amanita phalloides]